MPIADLDPLDKIREPALYTEVYNSVKANGLYNPVIILKISREEWLADTELDKDMLPPPIGGDEMRNRIQCGNNRVYALIDLGYTHVESIVCENKWAAYGLCHTLRVDKRWRRPGNWGPKRGT